MSFKIGNIQNVHQVFTAGFPVLSTMAIFFVMFTLRAGRARDAASSSR